MLRRKRTLRRCFESYRRGRGVAEWTMCGVNRTQPEGADCGAPSKPLLNRRSVEGFSARNATESRVAISLHYRPGPGAPEAPRPPRPPPAGAVRAFSPFL